MKRIVTIFFMCLLSFFSFSQTKDSENPIEYRGRKNPKIGSTWYLDYKCGFKDFVLGNNISNYNNVIKDFTEIEDDVYDFFEVDSALFINEIPIKRVILGAYNNKIARIVVQFDSNFGSDVYGILSAAYGRGIKNNRYLDKYYWLGADVTMGYDFEGRSDSNLIISSNLLTKQIEKDKRQNRKRATSDL